MHKVCYIYILASQRDGVLYVGVTSNLLKRIAEHKQGVVDGFTKRYFVKKLIYFEECPDIQSAILREKQLKGGSRADKIKLIEQTNPNWIDLYDQIIG